MPPPDSPAERGLSCDGLIELSRRTRESARLACLAARLQAARARLMRRLAAQLRAGLHAACGPRKRRVLVYLCDPAELARVCREFAHSDCEIVATSEYAHALAEIQSHRSIDLLVTQETLAGRPPPRLLH